LIHINLSKFEIILFIIPPDIHELKCDCEPTKTNRKPLFSSGDFIGNLHNVDNSWSGFGFDPIICIENNPSPNFSDSR